MVQADIWWEITLTKTVFIHSTKMFKTRRRHYPITFSIEINAKGPVFRLGPLLYLMSGSLWRASCPPPYGPLLRNVQIRSRRICPPQETTHRQTTDKQRPSLSTEPFVLFDVWQFPTLAWGDPTLPSALRRFTSEFGMGSGGTTALLPPDKFFSNTEL